MKANLLTKKLNAFPKKLEGLVFRLQERKDVGLKRKDLVLHWGLENKRLVSHWEIEEH